MNLKNQDTGPCCSCSILHLELLDSGPGVRERSTAANTVQCQSRYPYLSAPFIPCSQRRGHTGAPSLFSCEAQTHGAATRIANNAVKT